MIGNFQRALRTFRNDEAVVSAVAKDTGEKEWFLHDVNEELNRSAGPELPLSKMKRAKLLPNRSAALDFIPKGGVAIEVGVAYGDFSDKILKTLKPKKLYLLDFFVVNPGDPEFWGMSKLKDAGLSHFEFIEKRFKRQITSGKVELKKGFSWDTIAAFEENSVDFLYLDAAHDYESVKKDIAALLPVMKNGGIVQFNDYVTWSPTEQIPYGVVKAVNEFLLEGKHEVLYYCMHKTGFADLVVKIKK